MDRAHAVFIVSLVALPPLLGAACGRSTPLQPEPVRVAPPPPAAPTDIAAPASELVTPEPGSVLVIYRTAEGAERVITCGGDISLTPGRELQRLERK